MTSYRNYDVLTELFVDTSNFYLSCTDWMSSNAYNSLDDGVYNISRIVGTTHYTTNTEELQVYCKFDYINNYSWTLVESGSLDVMQSDLAYADFVTDISYNMESVASSKNTQYRLSLDWMDSVRIDGNNDLMLASCNFNTSFAQDWVLMNLTKTTYDPFEMESFGWACTHAISADIRYEYLLFFLLLLLVLY